MKLIVGLGNPGKQYQNTRHNIGYMVVDNYAKNEGVEKFSTKFNAEYAIFIKNDEKYILVKPLTYMNLSGDAVRAYVDYYDIPKENILIIQDDLDLEVGSFKLKNIGSHGGHNGVHDIMKKLNVTELNRLKLGIGRDTSKDTADYVLGKFSKKDRKLLDNQMTTISNVIDDFGQLDILKLMNKYN